MQLLLKFLATSLWLLSILVWKLVQKLNKIYLKFILSKIIFIEGNIFARTRKWDHLMIVSKNHFKMLFLLQKLNSYSSNNNSCHQYCNYRNIPANSFWIHNSQNIATSIPIVQIVQWNGLKLIRASVDVQKTIKSFTLPLDKA